MIRILHISDSHAQWESMVRLGHLARLCSHCDVIAHTGDFSSTVTRQAPKLGNDWPASLKFSVPGNHDDSETYALLEKWWHNAPWTHAHEDLGFLGVPWNRPQVAEDCLADIDLCNVRGIVLLFHMRPTDRLIDTLLNRIENRPLLVLHGHEHPRGFSGTEWDDCASLAGRNYCRSKVCSSVSDRRGLGHVISWDGNTFRLSIVQGPDKLATAEPGTTIFHPAFGEGRLVKRETQGSEMTVYFPAYGQKKTLASYPGLLLEDEVSSNLPTDSA